MTVDGVELKYSSIATLLDLTGIYFSISDIRSGSDDINVSGQSSNYTALKIVGLALALVMKAIALADVGSTA